MGQEGVGRAGEPPMPGRAASHGSDSGSPVRRLGASLHLQSAMHPTFQTPSDFARPDYFRPR